MARARPAPVGVDALLLAAAVSGDARRARGLVDLDGADPAAVGENGVTALMLAVEHGQYEIARLLVAAEADVDAEDANKRTALMRAVAYSKVGIGPATTAALRREMVETLLDARARVDVSDMLGKTVLMLAAESDDPELLHVLLRANANVDTADKLGDSALLLACRRGAVENVRILIGAGASVDGRNVNGETALTTVVTSSTVSCAVQCELVRELLRARASVDMANACGRTALMLASTSGHIEVVVELLNGGARTGASCVRGNTALMYAVERDNYNAVEALLQAGADPTIKNSDGVMVTDLLASGGDHRCSEPILRALHQRQHHVENMIESITWQYPTSFDDAMAPSECNSIDDYEVMSDANTVSTEFTIISGVDNFEVDHIDHAPSYLRVGQAIAQASGVNVLPRQAGYPCVSGSAAVSSRSEVDTASRNTLATNSSRQYAVVERSNDGNSIVIVAPDSNDQFNFPFHFAVVRSGGDPNRFEELVVGITSDPNTVKLVRLATRVRFVTSLCAAEYAHLIGYHEVGQFLAAKMDTAVSSAVDTSDAVCVTLLEDSAKFSFVFAAMKSNGSVEQCAFLLGDDEGDEDDRIDSRIQAEVIRDVDTRFMSWTSVELACQLGYVHVVNNLLMRNYTGRERKPVIRARALERAVALRC